MKLSKLQLLKNVQPGGFISRLIIPLLKVGLPLMTNVLKSLAKSS